MSRRHIGSESEYHKVTLTTNVSGAAFPEKCRDMYLYDVYVLTSTDDAVTVSVADYDSRPLLSATATSSATSGEYITISKYRQAFGIPTYTVSGLGGGNAVITFIWSETNV